MGYIQCFLIACLLVLFIKSFLPFESRSVFDDFSADLCSSLDLSWFYFISMSSASWFRFSVCKICYSNTMTYSDAISSFFSISKRVHGNTVTICYPALIYCSGDNCSGRCPAPWYKRTSKILDADCTSLKTSPIWLNVVSSGEVWLLQWEKSSWRDCRVFTTNELNEYNPQ